MGEEQKKKRRRWKKADWKLREQRPDRGIPHTDTLPDSHLATAAATPAWPGPAQQGFRWRGFPARESPPPEPRQ